LIRDGSDAKAIGLYEKNSTTISAVCHLCFGHSWKRRERNRAADVPAGATGLPSFAPVAAILQLLGILSANNQLTALM
jgi:hypothetical protein